MKRPEISDIINVVCDAYGITIDYVKQRSRKPEVLLPRQIIHYLAKALTKGPDRLIGEMTGGYDHATVISSYKKLDWEYGRYDDSTELIDIALRALEKRGFSTKTKDEIYKEELEAWRTAGELGTILSETL